MRCAGTDGPDRAMRPGNAGGAKGPDTLAAGRGQPAMGGTALQGKPYEIPKQLVWEAYQRVKANHGAAGVDGQSLVAFEKDLKASLYKVWNRMSSGSYLPLPVRLVEIPKDDGSKRPLGIPTVADRVAQTVVKMVLEPSVEAVFHPDSYGYRPGRSALDAVGVARQRCWKYDWLIELDIKAFFDTCDHELSSAPWLTTPMCRGSGSTSRGGFERPCEADGTLARGRGAPRKAASSVRCWLTSSCTMRSTSGCAGAPGRPFERYADDAVVHCESEAPGPGGRGGHPGSVRAMPSGVAPDQDAHRVLQGRPTGPEARHVELRLPRVHLPTSTGEESPGQVLREASYRR